MSAQMLIDWLALLGGLVFLALLTFLSVLGPRDRHHMPGRNADRFIPGNWTPHGDIGAGDK